MQDRTAVEDDYQLVSAAEVILNESRDLRDVVLAQRADKEESDSEDQENAQDSSERGPSAVPARLQAPPQLVEQKPAKQVRKKPKTSLMSQIPRHSTPHPVPLDILSQPQQVQPERAHTMDAEPSSSAAAMPSQHTPQAAASRHNKSNSQAQGSAGHAQWLPDTQPEVEVLDAQSRETRMCAWCPTDAVLASG